MVVVPRGTDCVTVDSTGRNVFVRYRVCVTPECEMYLLRQETLEIIAPTGGQYRVLTPDHTSVQRLGLPPRSAPLPDRLCRAPEKAG